MVRYLQQLLPGRAPLTHRNHSMPGLPNHSRPLSMFRNLSSGLYAKLDPTTSTWRHCNIHFRLGLLLDSEGPSSSRQTDTYSRDILGKARSLPVLLAIPSPRNECMNAMALSRRRHALPSFAGCNHNDRRCKRFHRLTR